MASQMIACDGGSDALREGYVAVMQRKTCFVFQLKRVERSNDRGSQQCWSRWVRAALRSCRGLCTSVKVKFDMSIFFFLLTVIVWTTSHPTNWISDMINIGSCRSPYTCTFRSLTLADGAWGEIRTESAMAVATQNATVVKSPNTFCARTRVECILAFRQHMYSGLWCWSIAHTVSV